MLSLVNALVEIRTRLGNYASAKLRKNHARVDCFFNGTLTFHTLGLMALPSGSKGHFPLFFRATIFCQTIEERFFTNPHFVTGACTPSFRLLVVGTALLP